MDEFACYHDEFTKNLFSSLNLLQKSNITFRRDVSFCERNWRFLYLLPVQMLHYASFTAFIVKLFVEGGDIFKNPDMIPLWLVSTELWIKGLLLIINRKQIREVIIHLGSTWRTEGINDVQIEIKNQAQKILNIGEVAFNKLGLVVASLYLILPLSETVVRRLILNQDVELNLVLECVYPFEVNTWPVYLVVYSVQVFCTFHAVHIYLGVGWLIVVLTSHIVVQFLLLQEDLLHIKPKQTKKENNVSLLDEITYYNDTPKLYIQDFVKRHQDIILLVEKMNASFNKLTFTILLFATLIICFFAVAGKASGPVDAAKNYGAITVVMVNIFILCYYSQLLSSASSGVALAAAKNLWYEADIDFQTNIYMIMIRSQEACALTSLYSHITMDTFNKVLKTTWSYFSLASQMYDEKQD